jgi:pentatricopeptide repeat-containing protein PET309
MRQPSSPSPSPPAPLPGPAELLNLDTLHSPLFALLGDVEKGVLSPTQPGVADLTKFIVHNLVSSKEKLMELPIGTILLLFEKLIAVGFIEPLHYFRAITTLQSQGSRAANTKSVLIYRNFRWRMPDEPSPTWLLEEILAKMRSLRNLEGVDYFLQEFRHLHGKPSLEAYHNALTTFARCGDSSGINEVFRHLVEDHGPPTDQKLISPLLYIHAKVGNVKETKSQLQSLSREFSFKPNAVCWNILLTAHANRGDLDGAIDSFRDMSKHGTAPDSHSFGIMMGLFAKRGDYRAVKKLIDVARRDKVPLTGAMIDPMVEALCRSSKYAEAEELALDALLLDPPLDMTRTWNLLLWNYAFTADFDSVSRIQAEMRKLGVAADGMTYASVMLTLILMRDTDGAREILRKLHRSRRIEVEQFHYSLIMLGYAREGNRDMVQILYREMTERFGDPGPSAKLSMLRSLIERDEWSQNGQKEEDDTKTKVPIRLERAERFLEPILSRFELSDYATSNPQPGSGRRLLRDAFPSVYYETLMSAYARGGAWDRAEELFDEYMKKAEQLSNPEAPPLQFMSAVMQTHLQKGRYKEVEDCWNSVRRRMVLLGTPVDINRLFQAPKDAKATSSKHKGERPGILRYYRFALSQCLSVYMESLSKQRRWANLTRLVGSVERQGFALTSANWADYIRLLCDSQRPEYQLLAFQHFEENFIQNFPGWMTLRQGYVRFPAQAPQSLNLLDRAGSQLSQPALMGRYARRAWAKIQPDFMQPDYLTMMHLASALVDLRFRAVVVGNTELDALRSKAPRTFEALSRLPLLTEEFQSDLRLYLKPQTPPSPRSTDTSGQRVFTGGLLGSDGDWRIDTSPKEVTQEDFTQFDGSVVALGRHFDDQGLLARTSEPDEETLRYLLAEDAQGHESVWRDSVSEPHPSGPLQAQDEQDLEYESRLVNEPSDETEERTADPWNAQSRRS